MPVGQINTVINAQLIAFRPLQHFRVPVKRLLVFSGVVGFDSLADERCRLNPTDVDRIDRVPWLGSLARFDIALDSRILGPGWAVAEVAGRGCINTFYFCAGDALAHDRA